MLLLLQSRKGGICGVIFAYRIIGYLYSYSIRENENVVLVVAGADERWKKIKQTTEKLFEGVTHEKEW